MKQKPITLRKFIETFPHYSTTVSKIKQIPDNFDELDYLGKYDCYHRRLYDKNVILRVRSESIYLGTDVVNLKRVGNRIFKTHEFPEHVYIKPSGIKIVGTDAIVLITKLLELCGIDWFRDINKQVIYSYFIKSSVLHGILTKRIYSQETLYKAIASKVYGIRDLSWKAMREYCSHTRYFNLHDLYYFTRNCEESIHVISLAPDNMKSILADLLAYAVSLNQIVDFGWTLNRINIEHQAQIRTSMAKEIASKQAIPIYKHVVEIPGIRLLNTEQDIFQEAQVMHHCLYNCYFNRIKDKTYIAFHMCGPEDCTFSVIRHNNIVVLDQIYLKYDVRVADSTRDYALKFIKDYQTELNEMFNERIVSNTATTYHPINYRTIEIPYDIPF